jgi:hypothetical protein
MNHNESSRRDFLKHALSIGALSVAGGAVLTACGKQKKQGGGGCNDVSGLSEADKTLRTANEYADVTPDKEQDCTNCELYTLPAAGAACGGCKVLKGPVAPKGWCKLWAKKVG